MKGEREERKEVGREERERREVGREEREEGGGERRRGRCDQG